MQMCVVQAAEAEVPGQVCTIKSFSIHKAMLHREHYISAQGRASCHPLHLASSAPSCATLFTQGRLQQFWQQMLSGYGDKRMMCRVP